MLRTDKYDYKLLFENNTVGIVIVNKEGFIVEANNYASELLGYSHEELIQMKVEDLVPSDVRSGHEAYRKGYSSSPRRRVMGSGMDLHAQKKDGNILPVEISLSPFEKDGKILTTAFIIDSSIRRANEEKIKKQNQELTQIREELQKLNQDLEKKVQERTFTLQETLIELERSRNELKDALDKEKELGELKSRFVSMASHEFRTPLSTILSSASLINRYIAAQQLENCERHISRIKSSVEHLNSVLEDFLSIGRIEEGLIKVNNEEFEINTVIENIVNEMRELSKPQQTINILHSEPTFITSDKHLLKIAISNLISNAIKFSNDDGLIEVILEKKEEIYSIHVRDYGIGIPEEDQKHLFGRFFRASNSSNIQGTGLGIYIVKRYIEIIGGKIHFVSKQNEGTTITIDLQL